MRCEEASTMTKGQCCHDVGIPVPEPLYVRNNVLAMRFIGEQGVPSKSLLESPVDSTDYESALSLIRDLFYKAKLVHGDFSEYNIFKENNHLVVFDLGSPVDLRHPNAQEFLKRDINNITRFFKKRGISVEDPNAVLEVMLK